MFACLVGRKTKVDKRGGLPHAGCTLNANMGWGCDVTHGFLNRY